MRISSMCMLQFSLLFCVAASIGSMPAAVPDTGQNACFDTTGQMAPPAVGQAFWGQDAQFTGQAMRFRDNGDGTVTDGVTGLMWQQTPDAERRDQAGCERYAKSLQLAGHGDWRLPTIQELVSIADFMGNMHSSTPYIDTEVFGFQYPNTAQGENGTPGQRAIDAQYTTSSYYVGTTMRGDRSVFGFNFANGRVKS